MPKKLMIHDINILVQGLNVVKKYRPVDANKNYMQEIIKCTVSTHSMVIL